ncbi:porin family protein [Adhaeribacter rhizoryzae]|uniref:Uncharacterized protein n=1 Tax=Adhaeribacter rhizoryzae TaxID=2607907 RepID=A0A5M6DT44_9BACT|nr:hypothetical protein [Adhaeribacter rhizoryzae]KAA5549429.1 hypothetical protein F0145_02235 [Adhaeribacter rhizoryzae]
MRPANFWPELQVEYVLKNTSFFYFRNHYRFNFDDANNYLGEKGLTESLERVQVRAGYEQVFNNQWSLGIAESYAKEQTRGIFFNEVYARHISTFGKIRFAQRASFEHILRWPTNNNGRIRFRADLEQNINVGKRLIRPRLSYDLFYNISYQNPKGPNIAQRLVDRTRLRLEVLYNFNERFSATPYFTEQVDFTGKAPEYSAAGEIIKPASKQNAHTPIVGLDLRYVLFHGGEPFPRTLPSHSSK